MMLMIIAKKTHNDDHSIVVPKSLITTQNLTTFWCMHRSKVLITTHIFVLDNKQNATYIFVIKTVSAPAAVMLTIFRARRPSQQYITTTDFVKRHQTVYLLELAAAQCDSVWYS